MNVLPMMSRFSAWAYGRVYDSCATLSDDDYRLDRGAFFGSIHNTLTHLLVVDLLWVARIEGGSAGIKSLGDILFDNLNDLRAAQEAKSACLAAMTAGLDEAQFSDIISYNRVDGSSGQTALGEILITIFNHQTHHRGQITAMISQANSAYETLDVMYYLPETL
jgi:uncharacterized damage-inducible protein DinB